MSLIFTRSRVIRCTAGLAGALAVGLGAVGALAQARPASPAGVPAPARGADQPPTPSAAGPGSSARGGEQPASRAGGREEPPAAGKAAGSSEFGKIEERIKTIIGSIQKSAENLDHALSELDGGISGDSARKIDSRIGEIMTTAQSALDIAGNSGLLADRLAKLKATVEADENRIESLGQTDDQKRAMRERIAKQRAELDLQTRNLAMARQKALEKINETVQLRPIIAWYARRDKTDEVTERLKPLVKSVNELASSLDKLVQSALQDPSKVPN